MRTRDCLFIHWPTGQNLVRIRQRLRGLAMNSRFMVRITAPIVASSLLLLGVGVGAAWYVDRWQRTVSQDLRVNVSGIRAAEELEILVREARTRLDHFLITGDRKYLARVPELQSQIEHWLGEAERWGITVDEQRWMARVRRGNRRFWDELARIPAQAPNAAATDRVRRLIDDVLVGEMLEPAHAYLDFNEDEVKDAIDKNQAFADQLVYILLVVGTCGSAAGLLAGVGFARGLSRSLVQLSVLIRDTAGRLDVRVEPILVSGMNLGGLESMLRLIAERVGAMVERLQQREQEAMRAEQLAAVGQLAAGMAHELRNPLTSMKILVQGALAAPSADDDGEGESGRALSGRDLVVLEEEITRLERLLQSFLDFARPPKPEKRVMDVRPLVEQTIAFVAARAAAVSSTIDCVAPPVPLCVAVDPAQFRQVLLNLMVNALDAMPGGGTVDVRLHSESDGVLALDVADRGGGLPPALGERIFEPFTTTKETGLGLGLSICKRVAAAHGGTLSATNRKGGGAVFTFRLPTAAAEQ
jgi:signal transduction histidine kinase